MTRKSRTPLASVTANGAESKAHQASVKQWPTCLASAAPARQRPAHFARACGLLEEGATLAAGLYFAGCRS